VKAGTLRGISRYFRKHPSPLKQLPQGRCRKKKKGRSFWSGQYPGKCLLLLLCEIAKRFLYSVKS
jgi:hypothetical protein